MGISDDDIDVFDFDNYKCRFPSLANVDCPALKSELKVLRNYLTDLGTREQGLVRDGDPDVEGEDDCDDDNDWSYVEKELRTGADRDKNHYTHVSAVHIPVELIQENKYW